MEASAAAEAFLFLSRNRSILDLAVGIQGLVVVVLHLDGAILEFEYPIQGFEYHILKFMIFKQFDGLEMVAVV